MQWEIIATWAGLLVTVASGVYKMGKHAQQLQDLREQHAELKERVKETEETPIKLAALETDIKYLVKELGEIKNFLMQRK